MQSSTPNSSESSSWTCHKQINKDINPKDPAIQTLIQAAQKAKSNSYSHYSGFRVGAALKVAADKETIILGCNVENSSYPLTCCAERSAIFSAVSQGFRNFEMLALITDVKDTFSAPCGGCRKVMNEFGDFPIIVANESGKFLTYKVSDFLPYAFDQSQLDGDHIKRGSN